MERFTPFHNKSFDIKSFNKNSLNLNFYCTRDGSTSNVRHPSSRNWILSVNCPNTTVVPCRTTLTGVIPPVRTPLFQLTRFDLLSFFLFEFVPGPGFCITFAFFKRCWRLTYLLTNSLWILWDSWGSVLSGGTFDSPRRSKSHTDLRTGRFWSSPV